jgi:hypothetical protein
MMIPCSLWSEMIWNWSDNLDQKINWSMIKPCTNGKCTTWNIYL